MCAWTRHAKVRDYNNISWTITSTAFFEDFGYSTKLANKSYLCHKLLSLPCISRTSNKTINVYIFNYTHGCQRNKFRVSTSVGRLFQFKEIIKMIANKTAVLIAYWTTARSTVSVDFLA